MVTIKAIKSETAVFLIELPCSEDGCTGTFVKQAGIEPAHDYPHKCNVCKKEAGLSRQYPHLEYQNLPIPYTVHETEEEEI